MAKVQKQFVEFDNTIRLGRYEENATLREKRDRVLDRLNAGLKKQREDGEDIPPWSTFGQGSYSYGTGVVPAAGDYDIDQGIEFDVDINEATDPVKVKRWVYDALDGHTQWVEVRKPCVTVWYQAEGEPIYHVDVAVYASASVNGTMHLARGKLRSDEANREWEPSDPKGLLQKLESRFDGDDAKQTKRVIRALKRWSSERFPNEGHAAPPGIAFAVAAHEWFSPARPIVDPVANKVEDDDLRAMLGLVTKMLANFTAVIGLSGNPVRRLRLYLPVQPYNDVLERMTDKQMARLEDKLDQLRHSLEEAQNDPDPHTACKELRKRFGDDFPVPDKEETAQPKGPAIITSGNSA